MELNADFSQRVLIHSDAVEWLASPMPGVDRRMLDRIGGELARATTIVRYAPGSSFSPHIHSGGEEFIVLEGVFQDEHGDFPVGSYIRNPPTSQHTPGSELGCTIFVKLWQFDMNDRTPVKINMNKIGQIQDAARPGLSITPLFQDERETVQLESWAPHAESHIALPEGGEYLILSGSLNESGDELRQHSWLRIPIGGKFNAKAGAQGAQIWSKTRHLRYTDAPKIA